MTTFIIHICCILYVSKTIQHHCIVFWYKGLFNKMIKVFRAVGTRRGRGGGRGLIVRTILAEIEEKPSPLKDLGIILAPRFLHFSMALHVTILKHAFYYIPCKVTSMFTNVSKVMESLTCWFKMCLVLSTKNEWISMKLLYFANWHSIGYLKFLKFEFSKSIFHVKNHLY